MILRTAGGFVRVRKGEDRRQQREEMHPSPYWSRRVGQKAEAEAEAAYVPPIRIKIKGEPNLSAAVYSEAAYVRSDCTTRSRPGSTGEWHK